MADELLVFNGLNGATGEYDLPPMPVEGLSSFIEQEKPPENLTELRYRNQLRMEQHLGVPVGLTPSRLDQAGWGVILAQDADPEVLDALSELLAFRRKQAESFFQVFAGEQGYRRGDTKKSFLGRASAALESSSASKVVYNLLPEAVPYHLLIVGDPEQIPYDFQNQLDVGYAVGRIHFDSLQEYADYAANVVAAETDSTEPRRHAALFAPVHEGDQWTNLTADLLIEPLFKRLSSRFDWRIDMVHRYSADKTALIGLLGGELAPELLFVSVHGLTFPEDDPLQQARQGALVCQEYPGPQQWREPIPEDHYVAATDLPADADLRGQVVFCYGSNVAGSPRADPFTRRGFGPQNRAAPRPFLAALAKRLLGRPRGALAVIGQAERTWGYAFPWSGAGAQTTVFEGALGRLMSGDPVGLAVEHFDDRYTELATDLNGMMDDARFGAPLDHRELAGMWTATNDARAFVVIGDPAVRLAGGTLISPAQKWSPGR